MLFDNGESCRVACEIWQPSSEKAIQGYVIAPPCKDFDIAADKATYAACKSLISHGILSSKIQAVISLSGSEHTASGSTRTDSAGQSGGLAFALAVATALKKKQTPADMPKIPDIAATGVIDTDGKILKVGGLETKLEAAAQTLNENAYLLYPAQNRYKIPEHLETILKQRNIHAHAVDDLSQVLDLFFLRSPANVSAGTKPATAPPPAAVKKNWIWILAALLILAGIFAGGYLFLFKSDTPQPDAGSQVIKEVPAIPAPAPKPVLQPEPAPTPKPAPAPAQVKAKPPENDQGFD